MLKGMIKISLNIPIIFITFVILIHGKANSLTKPLISNKHHYFLYIFKMRGKIERKII